MWRHHLSLRIRGWKGPHWSFVGLDVGHPKPSNFCCCLTKIRMSEGSSLDSHWCLLRNQMESHSPVFPGLRSASLDRRGALPCCSWCWNIVPTTRGEKVSRGLRCRKFVSKSAFNSLVCAVESKHVRKSMFPILSTLPCFDRVVQRKIRSKRKETEGNHCKRMD